MSMEDQMQEFLLKNKDGIRMALAHSNFDEAIRVVFSAGYEAGYTECAVLATEEMREYRG